MDSLDKKGQLILIVDDVPKNIQVIGTILRKKGFMVSIAQSGSQALDIIEQNRPDLILLDIIMPGMDGFETCRRLKKDPATRDIPVIFLSALSDTVDKVKGLNIGAVDYVAKPIAPQEMLARINTQLTLQALYRKLENINVTLEEKVLLRTQELARKNEALQQLRNLLSSIINSMPSVLVGVDIEGKVTQWNREAEKATGMSSDAAHGRLVADVFPRLGGEMEKVRKAIRNRKPQKDTKVPINMNGETHFSDITIYPLVGIGAEGAVIRIDDVTARVRIEEMMIQSEKMMSVGGLAAGMAHEINNPLSAMLQGAQNVLRRTSPKLKQNMQIASECGTNLEAICMYLEKRKIFHFLEGIRVSGLRASRIVANMLQFSRPSESKKVAVSLPALVDRTVELASSEYDLKKQYDFRHIEIVKEYDPGLPEVTCVETEISQVILNLLRNAAEAMSGQEKGSEGPKIILRVRYDNAMARIEVEDNGRGMIGTVSKRVFEPFFTAKEQGSGTGLGLSVSYFIITRNHNGTMMVESVKGKGTTFIIELPI